MGLRSVRRGLALTSARAPTKVLPRMGIGAIVLGVFAFICMFGGIVLTIVPFLGTMLSFLSPVLALAGIVLGGVALSRAKQGLGESEGLAIGGLVTSIIAFIPGMLVALTCGLCNTCVTGAYLDPSITHHDAGPPRDSGVPLYAPIAPPPFPPALPQTPRPSLVPITPILPGTPTAPPPVAPVDPAPPPSDQGMPPPPLPAGPTTAMHPNTAP